MNPRQLAGMAGILVLALGASTTLPAEAVVHTCFGEVATIVGTPDDDQLRGTAGRDVIVGLGGQDGIDARAGNDRVCAGSGRDFVQGSMGFDRLQGGAGRDFLEGERGRDRLYGGRSRRGAVTSVIGSFSDGYGDFLNGGKDDDRLHGEGGVDLLLGEVGDDLLDGGRGEDWGLVGTRSAVNRVVTANLATGKTSGSGGSDILRSIDNLESHSYGPAVLIGDEERNKLLDFEGADVLKGRAGNDVLVASRDDDALWGGRGNDALVFREGDFSDDSNDRLRGGPGIDTVDYSQWPLSTKVTVNLSTQSASGESIGQDTIETVENVFGGPRRDDVTGDDAANHLFGGGGDDLLRGAGGNDYLNGNIGTNRNRGGRGRDRCTNPTTAQGAVK